MDYRRFDEIAKSLGPQAPRRRVLAGLGGLALGSLGVVAGARAASAQVEAAHDDDNRRERRCKRRCEDRHEDNDRRRRRCKRRCEDRYDD